MKLLSLLNDRMNAEESYFRQALLREDIARIEVLVEKSKSADTFASLMKDGLYIGWTKSDLRTGELKEHLEPFMAAVFAFTHGKDSGKDADIDQQAIIDTWITFNQERMKILVHCL